MRALFLSCVVICACCAYATDFNWDSTMPVTCAGDKTGIRLYYNKANTISNSLLFVNGNIVGIAAVSGSGSGVAATLTWHVAIPNGAKIHVGLSCTQSVFNDQPFYAYPLDASGQEMTACIIHFPLAQIHNPDKKLDAGVGHPDSKCLIKGISAEYYVTHQPLDSLNATTKRDPIDTQNLEVVERVLGPNEHTSTHYNAPSEAKFVVFDITSVDPDHANSANRLWAEFSLDNDVVTKRRWYVWAVAGGVICFFCGVVILKRRRRD